jgi:hypothetical protein
MEVTLPVLLVLEILFHEKQTFVTSCISVPSRARE